MASCNSLEMIFSCVLNYFPQWQETVLLAVSPFQLPKSATILLLDQVTDHV
jgi:hypothetical protein